MTSTRSFVIRTSLFIGLVVTSLPAFAIWQDHDKSEIRKDVPELLMKAIQTTNKHRYKGVRVVDFSRGPLGMRHEEYITREGKFVRIEFPADSKFSGQIIVENGKERRHFFPDKNEVRILPPRREEALNRLVRFASRDGVTRWSLKSAQGDMVAGHATSQVVVSDPFGNVVDRIFIEPKTGVVLRRRIYDKVGSLIGFFEFEKIDFRPPRFDPSIFRVERKGAAIVTPYDSVRQLAATEGFGAVMLEPSTGYKLEWARVTKAGRQDVLVQIYSSGTAKLSLFQFKGSADEQRLQAFARKDFRVKSWTHDGRTFVLMGSISEETLTRLARGIGYNE